MNAKSMFKNNIETVTVINFLLSDLVRALSKRWHPGGFRKKEEKLISIFFPGF